MAKVFKLFSDIIITEGYSRAIIQDYHRHKTHLIPLNLSQLIQKYNSIIKVDYLMQLLQDDKNQLYKEYFEFLVENDLIFSVEEKNKNLYPPISLKYDVPFHIDSLTILISKRNHYDIYASFKNGLFDNIYCISILFCDDISSLEMDELINIIISTETRYLHVVHNSAANQSDILRENKNPLIAEIPVDFSVDSSIFSNNKYREFPFFHNEFYLYVETLRFNSYFHKRIYIDDKGYLRNTPETPNTGIHINDISSCNELFDLVDSRKFSKYGYIPKCKIEVCRCCEYRYMCVDNRIPIKEGKRWAYTDSCTYNPYICLWKGQEGYVPVEECGTYSRETGFVPDKKRIDKLNKEIWGEE